jgi:hypothetical protein
MSDQQINIKGQRSILNTVLLLLLVILFILNVIKFAGDDADNVIAAIPVVAGLAYFLLRKQIIAGFNSPMFGSRVVSAVLVAGILAAVVMLLPRPRLRIRLASVGDLTNGYGCDITVEVAITSRGSTTGHMHVCNAYYDPCDVWHEQIFTDNQSIIIHLGATNPDFKYHEIYISSDIGDSNHLASVACNNWP